MWVERTDARLGRTARQTTTLGVWGLARVAADTGRDDWWAIVLFALVAIALLAGGLMSPAVFTQTQTVDFPAVVLGVAGLIGAAALLSGGTPVVLRTRLGFAWISFLAWGFVAAVFSGRALAAFVGEPTNLLGFWVLLSLVAIVCAVAWRGQAAREVLETAAPWILLLQFGWVAVAFMRVDWSQPFVPDLVARGTLPNSTGLGATVLLLLPWLLVRPSGERFGLPAWARFTIAAGAVVTLAIGQSRVALVVAVVWILWMLLNHFEVRQRTRSIASGVFAGVLILAAVAYVATQLQDPRGGQLGLRPEFARTAIAAAAASPFVGFGPDGFVAGGASVSTPEFASKINPLVFARGAVDPHNILLWVVVSTGVVGLALFLWAFVEVVLAWRARSQAGFGNATGVWAVAGAFIVFLTAPASLAMLPLFAFVLGITLAGRPNQAGDQQRGIADYALIGVLGLSGLLLAANAFTRLPLERPGAEDSPRLANTAQVAANLWIADPYLAYLASNHWAWAGQTDQSVVVNQLDLVAMERATELDDRDPFLALERARIARFYQLPTSQVEAAYAEALRRWPIYPAARLEFAEYLIGLGRLDEASEQLAVVSALQIEEPGFRETVERLERAAEGEVP